MQRQHAHRQQLSATHAGGGTAALLLIETWQLRFPSEQLHLAAEAAAMITRTRQPMSRRHGDRRKSTMANYPAVPERLCWS